MALMLALLAAVSVAGAHPLHTTMTDLTIDESRHSIRAVVRVFSDDLASAAQRSRSADQYFADALSITGRNGARVSLAPCGTRRQGDVLFVCVEGSFAGSASDLRLSNPLLFDVYKDQVNVVQVSTTRDHRSLLFVRGDAAKPVL
jgi:hypothetical protein